MSDCPRHRRASEIFGVVCDLAPAARTSAIAESCHGDEELAAEVRSLLAFDEGEPTLAEAMGGPEPLDDEDGPLPERIGDFTIERLLGQGGMGRVYLARQQNPQRLVALKVLPPGWSSAEQLAMLQREAQLLGGLKHGAIAHVYAAGVAQVEQRQTPYFVMEYVDGRTLLEHTEAEGLSVREKLRLLVAICGGVSHAHQRSIIHRDLKPSNIMVEASGQPKILDFGVAVSTAADGSDGERATRRPLAFGTPSYMSPEQFGSDPAAVDTRVDVYALGVLMYELLVGERPYREGPPLPRADGTPPPVPPLSSFDSALKGDLSAIAAKAIAFHREDRFATVSELAEELERFLAHQPVRARQGGPRYRLGLFVRRHQLASALTVILVLSVAGWFTQVLGQKAQLSRQRDALAVSLVRQRELTERSLAAEQQALVRLAETHVRAADLAAQRGAWHQARSEVNQALALGGVEQAELLPRLVRASIALGDMARAKAELDTLSVQLAGLELPNERLASEGLLLRGVVQLTDGRTRDLGFGSIEDALDGDLSDADELYAMGLSSPTAGGAGRLFAGSIMANPFHHLAWQATLEMLALSGRLTETMSTAEVVLRLFPDDRTALLYRAGAAILLDKVELAEQYSREVEDLLGTPSAELLVVVRRFRELLELGIGPGDGSLPTMAEVVSRTLQILTQASQILSQVSSREPTVEGDGTLFLAAMPQLRFVVESYARAVEAFGAASFGDLAESRRLLNEAMRINPTSLFGTLLGVNALTFAPPDFAAAEAAYRRSLEIEPFSPAFRRDAEVQLLICQQQLLLRQDDEAVRKRLAQSLDTLLSRDELTGDLCRLLCQATLNIERDDLGRRVVERWKRLAPRDPEPLVKSSIIEFNAHAYWRAIDEARAALILSPTEELAQQVVATARQRLRERELLEEQGLHP